MSIVPASPVLGTRSSTRRRRSRSTPFLALLAVVALVMILPSGAAAQDGEATFRPACDLVTADQVSQIVGTALTGRGIGPQFCVWEGDGISAFLTLEETGGIELNRVVWPDAQDLSVADREALSIQAAEGIPASAIVALDEAGVLRVQVMPADGVPADPVAAAVAIAEAAFASGPILARPAVAPSGPALGFSGPACDLVTLEEVQQAMGDDRFSSATEDFELSCSYGTDDFSLLVSVSITEGDLFFLGSDNSVDLTVGGRTALWSPDMLNGVFVDIGGGRLLQVALIIAPGDPAELQASAQAMAEIALGRMEEVGEPAPETAAPAGPGCDLLSAEDVAAITGLPFTRADDTDSSGTGCSFSTSDPANEPWFIIITRAEIEDPATALELFDQDMAGLPEPEAIEVAGQPALRGANDSVALTVVDLDGIAGQEGVVLAVVWFFAPAEVDIASLVVRLAEAAVGNL